MDKALVAMLACSMFFVSPSAFAQAMDAKADCNKDAVDWMAAYNKGDAEAIANVYDPNSGSYSDLFWTAAGHDALLAGFKKQMSDGGELTSIVCDHSNRMGSKTVADGTWAGKAKGPDGKEASFQGHWMTVSEIHDGKSVVLTHLSNMDALPPSAPK